MRPQKVFPLINSIREYRESGGDSIQPSEHLSLPRLLLRPDVSTISVVLAEDLFEGEDGSQD